MLYYVYILFSLSLYLQSPSLALQATATIATDSEYDYGDLSRQENWADNCLYSQEYVSSKVKTCLLVYDRQFTYRVDTSPFEIYSAGRLKENKHSRRTTPASELYPIEVSTAVIPVNQLRHLDYTNDAVHVYRLGSSKLQHYLKDSKFTIALVAQTILKYSDTDKKRKRGCGRILNFGVNGDYGTTTKETSKLLKQKFYNLLHVRTKCLWS